MNGTQKVPPLLTLKKSVVLWQGEFLTQVVDELFDEEFAEEFRSLFCIKHRDAPYRVIPNKIENIPDVVQEAANWWAYAIQSPKTVKWEVRQFSAKEINQFKETLVREIMYDFEECDCCFLDSCTEALDILIESGVTIGLKVNDLPIDVSMRIKKEAVSLIYNSSRGGNFIKI